jgi:hypothetical protein
VLQLQGTQLVLVLQLQGSLLQLGKQLALLQQGMLPALLLGSRLLLLGMLLLVLQR